MSELFTTRINIPEENIKPIVGKLNKDLAITMQAQMVVKFAHWNVKGDGFHPTHLLFDEIYELVADFSDTIAERITALGGIAEGKPERVMDVTGYNYGATAYDNVRNHIEAMADYISDVSNSLRDGISVCGANKDLVSQDVYIELCRKLDKYVYFLEASLRA